MLSQPPLQALVQAANMVQMVPWPFPRDPALHIDLTRDDDDEE
jgi:hypothetical protein